MWNQKNRMRNRYLQMQLSSCNVEVINKSTKYEFKKICELNIDELAVSFKRIQPVKSKLLKDVRSSLAYGFWGLQKIVKELSSDDSRDQMSALNTLHELLLNKLELQRSIFKFDIVRRLQNILLRRRAQIQKEKIQVPAILRCFVVLSCSLQGSLQISKRPNLLNEFYRMAKSGEYAVIPSCILKNLTQHPQVLDYFIVKTNLYIELCDHLKENFVAFSDINLLEHFSHFLKIHPQIAINQGLFELLIREVPEKKANQQILIKCFALLLNCKDGQDRLDRLDGVRVLYEILQDEQLETYEYVVQALQSATCGSKISLWRCRELWNMPNALVRRSHDKTNEIQQLYSLKTLRQITTMPSIKKYIRAVCLPQIESIESRNESVKEAKSNLLKWLKTDVYNKMKLFVDPKYFDKKISEIKNN